MRFVCLGYYNEADFNRLPPEEQQSFMDRCFAYDDELRRGGHFLGGEALQSVDNSVTLHWHSGQAAVTDGPFPETKEVLGGLLFLEARDLNHAIALMSKHPGLQAGPFVIRPVDEEINALVRARDKAFQKASI